MDQKKTNLCVAADLTKTSDILNLIEKIGPYICLLKTHIDIIEDFNENFINSLKSLSKKFNFLIMEDRKFGDIGNTVSLQYDCGLYKISYWADLVTAHSISGPGILKGLNLKGSENRGVVLIAELSSDGNLITPGYTESTIKMIENYTELVTGIVCQNNGIVNSSGLIQMTPGVNINDTNDDLGQKYNSPEFIITERGADIGIVGRGIINSKNIESTAELYRDRMWSAYCQRISN